MIRAYVCRQYMHSISFNLVKGEDYKDFVLDMEKKEERKKENKEGKIKAKQICDMICAYMCHQFTHSITFNLLKGEDYKDFVLGMKNKYIKIYTKKEEEERKKENKEGKIKEKQI
eukprot:Phypoly_transcript_29855.p1 GENE.Phypoly_transcript_29855~~Phypoly_transcript_29855.p1  ORF type:complete len:115 (+),score=29.16 Phypoly_transcript_29855:26-370(+)